MTIDQVKHYSNLVFSNAGYAIRRNENYIAEIMWTEFYTLGGELYRLGYWPRELKYGHTLEGGL
jgi:hypothetical protein